MGLAFAWYICLTIVLLEMDSDLKKTKNVGT